MRFVKRTDLACEFIGEKTNTQGFVLNEYKVSDNMITHIQIDEHGEKILGKPCGNYYTIFTSERGELSEISEAVSYVLKEILPKGKCLVAGLGNDSITPDSLGGRTVRRVASTAQYKDMDGFLELGLTDVSVIETGVLAQTGIESAEQIKLISKGIGADFIVIVDSLACGERDRLGSTIQICDCGIAPGAGAGNNRPSISERDVGIPVIAVGVPTVIDLSAVTKKETDTMMITPRDIDLIIRRFSKIISKAINTALNPSLSENEIEKLLF